MAAILSGGIKDSSASSLPVQDWEIAERSSALRVYRPGEEIRYMAIVYNATRPGTTPELESQVTIFKDGKELDKGNVQKVDLHGITDSERIPIEGKMLISGHLDPGSYVLQMKVSDKQSKGNLRTAVQAIDFEILKSADESNEPLDTVQKR